VGTPPMAAGPLGGLIVGIPPKAEGPHGRQEGSQSRNP
jgi:hypothetical protein